MAGIHEVVRETPTPKRQTPLPGELLAQLRSQVARFEVLVAANRRQAERVEARLSELAG